jgi:hypothetical protein
MLVRYTPLTHPTRSAIALTNLYAIAHTLFMSRLYEQDADVERIETYLRRWWLWVISGVDGVSWAGDRFFWGYASFGVMLVP